MKVGNDSLCSQSTRACAVAQALTLSTLSVSRAITFRTFSRALAFGAFSITI